MSADNQRARPAPAFQEYASDMLANARYRTMSFAERGLMDTMRRECWVNGSIPKSDEDLAAYLGKSIEEIKLNLTLKVLHFFREKHDSLICPELDLYRTGLESRSRRMSEGGQKGGRATQTKNKVVKATLEAMTKPLSGGELSGDEISRGDIKSLGKGITEKEMNEFVAEYESTPDSYNEYIRASKGGH